MVRVDDGRQWCIRATPFSYDIPKHPLIEYVINEYISCTKASIQSANRSTHKRNNLTSNERQILNSLKNRKDIIIKKQNTIVVETTANYIKDGLAHLNNENFYHRLSKDINPDINLAILKFLNNAHQRGYIDKDTFNYLSPPTNFRTPLIYFLKKLHKSPISVRPIVSHVNSPISAFIDSLLKPIVREIPHIFLNSLQLIKDSKSISITDFTILVTLDVMSLYPNIPIEQSIEIILNYIETHNNPTYPPLCIIKTMLNFVFKHNCFNFRDLFFLQVHGIAMGTKLAPNYANLFMTHLEENFVFNYHIQPIYYKLDAIKHVV